jgi:protein-disulfide isomerase
MEDQYSALAGRWGLREDCSARLGNIIVMNRTIHSWCIFLPALLLALFAASASAEPGASSPTDAISAAELAREREALLQVMAAARAPATEVAHEVDLPDAAVLGSADAPMILIEFADYQCGFCRRHVLTVMPGLIEAYVNAGRLLYVFMEFPAEERGPPSLAASNAALCAGEQGQYWEMRERLYTNPYSLDPLGLKMQGRALELEPSAYARCIETLAHEEIIRAHMGLGRQLAVRGTPTFFLGVPAGDGDRIQLVRRIVGAQPAELFRAEIDAALSARADSPAPAFSPSSDCSVAGASPC